MSRAMVMDGEGTAYFAAITRSDDFPVTDTAYDTTFNGGNSEGEDDVAIVGFSTLLNELKYASYLGGGEGPDIFSQIHLQDGSIYITGSTGSPDFPVTDDAYDSDFHGPMIRHADGFFSKLSGSSLTYSTYFGSKGGDFLTDVLIGKEDEVILIGQIADAGEMRFSHIFSDEMMENAPSVCLLRLNAGLNGLLSASLLGPAEAGVQAVLDQDGNIYITGTTQSADFPVTEGAYDTAYNEGGDVFLMKLSPEGDAILFSTYLGGSGYDAGPSICLDNENNVIVYGKTQSRDFPITEDALDAAMDGESDLFIARISGDGGDLIYSSFLGGAEIKGTGFLAEAAGNVVTLPNGNILLCGTTTASDHPVTVGAVSKSNSGGEDVFITLLGPDLADIVYSTYLGGGQNDLYPTVGMDGNGNITCVCTTQSPDFPVTSGAYDETFNGVYDIAVFSLRPAP